MCRLSILISRSLKLAKSCIFSFTPRSIHLLNMHLCSICKADTSNALAIACGICFSSAHASCLGFKGPDCDKMLKHSGIRYFCSVHEGISPSSIVGKFRKLKSQFDHLSKCFTEMYSILSNENLLLDAPLVMDGGVQTEPTDDGGIQTESSDNVNVVMESVSSRIRSKRKGPDVEVPIEIKKKKSDSKVLNPPKIGPTYAAVASCPNSRTDVVSIPDHNSSSSELAVEGDEELQTLDPPKVVFLSNFAKSSTEEKIQSYVAKRITDGLSSIFIEKMKLPDNREYASFKITVRGNDVLYNSLLRKDFWPRNAFVKPFLRRVYQAVIPE